MKEAPQKRGQWGEKPNLKLRRQGELIKKFTGPIAMACGCRLCGFTVSEPRPPKGQAGKGWGFRTYGILRGRIVRHLKEMHPEALEIPPGGYE